MVVRKKEISLYEEIKSNLKSPKALESLDRVNKAIEFFIKENVDFNVSSIGRYCVDSWGSPKSQSIRNNKKLVEYIKFKHQEYKNSSIKVVDNSSNEIVFIEGIEDDRIKKFIQVEQEKYKILENKYNNLKTVVSNVSPIDIDELIKDNLNMDDIQDLNDTNIIQATKQAISADKSIDIEGLLEVINTKFLNNLSVNLLFKNGIVFNETTGSIIFDTNSRDIVMEG